MPETKDSTNSHKEFLYGKERNVDFFYHIPDNGINQNTGLLGIHTSFCPDYSNIFFKKIRKYFSNNYNLITFSVNFMGVKATKSRRLEIYKINPDIKKIIFQEYDGNIGEYFLNANQKDLRNRIIYKEIYDKNIWNNGDYNDYGLIQSLDIINVILFLIEKYKHLKNIGLFGSSLGAYISSMVYKFIPEFIDYIIDVSGLVEIEKERIENKHISSAFINMNNALVGLKTNSPFNSIRKDELEIRSLLKEEHFNSHYNTLFMFFTGSEDYMVPLMQKKKYYNILKKNKNNVNMKVLTPKNIDENIFLHAGHSLGGKVFEILKYSLDNYNFLSIKKNEQSFPINRNYHTSNGFFKRIIENNKINIDFHKN